MSINWQILHRAGVPLAGFREGVAPRGEEVAAQVLAVRSQAVTERERQAVAAFVAAWHDHYPTSFAASFGPAATEVTAWSVAARGDAGRFIKLRRLALANLSTVW